MKDVRFLLKNPTRTFIFLGIFFLMLPFGMKGEGSVDFINYPGLRLFLWPQETHQLKVYANEGEFINVGASHIGISGGFISVYAPDGTLHTTFDGTGATAGMATINNDIEEKGGPTGGGTTMGTGYEPGIVEVQAGEAGVWTVMMEFPEYEGGFFDNIANDAPWDRMTDQPTIKRVVLAWDITISQMAAANDGGTMLEGRVYANKFASMVSRNDNSTSPTYFVLTKQGFLYQVDCNEIDPFGFPIHSNTMGLVNARREPLYTSIDRGMVEVSNDISSWMPGNTYLFDPMAQDQGSFINNKIFFNTPNPDLPSTAMVTDVINMVTAETWMLVEAASEDAAITNVAFIGLTLDGGPCVENSMNAAGGGGHVYFETNVGGTAKLSLDLNNDGDYIDPNDRIIYKSIGIGRDSIYWDGLDGMDNPIPELETLEFNYDLGIRGGETHILMADVENNNGGVTFTRLNGPGAPIMDFYFDHSSFDDTAVSGGGTAGNPLETIVPYTYDSNWGNEKMLDYWAYVPYNSAGVGNFNVTLSEDCTVAPPADFDGDGILDIDDIDDENDGILDALEYCNPMGSFACLTNGLDPSGDADGDRVPNYLDVDVNECVDDNADGVCDKVLAEYDTDGDNVPDHLDVDSDNDGITDLVEAGHFQIDIDGNGVIDGPDADFGLNGFYNAIATDNDALTAEPTYNRWDVDQDGVPDHDDLDSDNDGINDVREGGYGQYDTNDDGRIDDGTGNVPTVGPSGLVSGVLDPNDTGLPIPYPMDHDMDGVPDWHDWDSDNDGINDVAEAGFADPENDGLIGPGTPVVDANGLAISDAAGMPLSTTSHPNDQDGDTIPDWHDLDSDNDGINDVAEAGFADPENDGIIGEGMPVVNVLGQTTEDAMGTPFMVTSNPIDYDGDMIPDWHDLDSDNDGINDVAEAGFADPDDDGIIGTAMPVTNPNGQVIQNDMGMPIMTTSNPMDHDGDTVPDWHDLDSDNDGINDVTEGGFADLDDDGIIGEGTPTVNEDGIATMDANGTPLSTTSNPVDFDGDMIPDWHDLDSDNDGINDVTEAGYTDPDGDGIIGSGMPVTNPEGQAIEDAMGNPLTTTSNPADYDGDMIPDWHDLDSDNDGINDVTEAGYDDPDNDGMIGTAIPVTNPNGQAIEDDMGNPIMTTSSPVDSDGDMVPDWHDLDSDNDGIHDVTEGGNVDPDNDGIIGEGTPMVNPNGQATTDPAGNPLNPTSNPADTDNDGTPDYLDLDSDADGINDVIEADLSDPDNDGIVGAGTPTTNDNGQVTEDGSGTPVTPTSNPTDSDNDGTPDFQEIDSDDDGIADNVECMDGADCPDTDGDGIPDFQDVDSDDDGLTDAEECGGESPCPDADGDGIPDMLEYTCSEFTIPVVANMSGAGVYCERESLTIGGMNTISALIGVSEMFYQWTGPNGFLSTGSTPVLEGAFEATIPMLTVGNEGTYTLVLTTDRGCESAPLSLDIDVTPLPQTPLMDVSQNVLCNADMLELSTSPYTGDDVTYQWFYNDGANTAQIAETTVPVLTLNEITNDTEGVYSMTVIAEDCQSDLSTAQVITVLDESHLDAVMDDIAVEFGDELLVENLDENDFLALNIVEGWEITITSQPTNGQILQDADGNYTYVPDFHFYGEDQATYELCSTLCPDICDQTDITLRVVDRAEWGECFVPNLITPNGDGYNDALFIPCAIANPNNEIMVFNRWGDKVFEKTFYQNDWTGTYEGENLPNGTYFYIFNYNRDTGAAVNGYLTIKR